MASTEYAKVTIGRVSPLRIAEALAKAGVQGVRVSERGCFAPVSDRLFDVLTRARGAEADFPAELPGDSELLQ